MAKKKILFIISSLTFGGAEKQTIDLINHLDASKIDLFFCYLKRIEHLKKEINQTQMSGLFCLDKKRKFDINVLLKLRRLIQNIQPEIIICINLYPTFYVNLVKFFFHLKYRFILVFHTTAIFNLYHILIHRFIYKNLMKNCDDIVFVCKNQMDYWIKKYNINKNLCQYIYNGIDLDYFTYRLSSVEKLQLRNQLNIKHDEVIICICAAMRFEKKHTDLISAGKLLVDKGLKVKILIIGDGPEKLKIEKHIKQFDMDKWVIFVGFQCDVRPYVAISDMLVICSISETFSIAILEAMALGKAIIASDIGGASEQVKDGDNGFLFSAGDVWALANCLERMIIEKLFVPMGKRSSYLIREKFSRKQMVKAYNDLILQ